ncbi:uncharacterized protein PAC_17186 [Phialocephala subalpina]|uniref:Uncharacterized protein n=1 Tax=Phialocephala subalpina TaxID=576137 RepID=A0A1L7XQS9_9HELO|nr:uncharacterized protein PAC_17186 [Phialocephala subalpina]
MSERGGGQPSVASVTQSMQNLQVRVLTGSQAKDEATKKQDKEKRTAARKAKEMADKKRAERQQNYDKWDKASLNLAAYYSDRPVVNDPNRVKANFFEISFQPGREYREYRIELGHIDNEEPSNKEFRRRFITIFLARNPLSTSAIWASDYCSTIISMGKLYSTIGSH